MTKIKFAEKCFLVIELPEEMDSNALKNVYDAVDALSKGTEHITSTYLSKQNLFEKKTEKIYDFTPKKEVKQNNTKKTRGRPRKHSKELIEETCNLYKQGYKPKAITEILNNAGHKIKYKQVQNIIGKKLQLKKK